MTERGYFVSFEGGDGGGKTTQARLLGDWLGTALGREVVVTREPGGTALGATLRQLILHGEDMDPRTEALLYAADRAHHVASLVRPALERGAVVITDRYLDSSVAYQSGGRELSEQEVEDLSLWAVRGLLPDVTILLDVDLATSGARMSGDLDRLERVDDAFRQRTRDAYHRRAAADPARWVVVDAAGTVEEVHAQVRAAVAERLHLPALDPAETPAAPVVEPVETTSSRVVEPAKSSRVVEPVETSPVVEPVETTSSRVVEPVETSPVVEPVETTPGDGLR
ncbi:thymidylate kinase [Xylanimonas cellulosilytica DSM 15894]|uniref:Thymidylate kinase n=1 Tax=Xylanimonas cellulosilytica (strain DSM 15894 / JCM 12276 / CECT 5975 / KCTC 9989 / LMG 20990 / NBRC 107835 / XIL07) TaxID=446471 RepID=D1BVC2_XYLCX|nr:thymidylate kinase [Xylanimonas cellulosilytica DSM 15894]